VIRATTCGLDFAESSKQVNRRFFFTTDPGSQATHDRDDKLPAHFHKPSALRDKALPSAFINASNT
jgi:hypothetical protein